MYYGIATKCDEDEFLLDTWARTVTIRMDDISVVKTISYTETDDGKWEWTTIKLMDVDPALSSVKTKLKMSVRHLFDPRSLEMVRYYEAGYTVTIPHIANPVGNWIKD